MSSTTRTRVGNLGRGALIGAVEAIPGISGGTIALVTGVYETLINSASHLVSAARAAVTDRARARAELRQVRWEVLLPLAVGMLPALVVSLMVLAPLIERYPVPMRALLLGMVTAALAVPINMVGRWRWREFLLAGVAAVAAFLLTGQVQMALEPSLPVVFVAASIAVCALALPGVSGAFLLLAFGLYTPTRDALRELDLAYIGVFLLGMVAGLSVFVKTLQWLLTHWRRVTVALMTGLMLGALRALWPWQTEDSGLLAPTGQVGLVILLCLIGAGLVIGVIMLERRTGERQTPPVDTTGRPPV